MSVHSYEELVEHKHHNIVCVTYGYDVAVALECETCNVVLLDFDNENSEDEVPLDTLRT